MILQPFLFLNQYPVFLPLPSGNQLCFEIDQKLETLFRLLSFGLHSPIPEPFNCIFWLPGVKGPHQFLLPSADISLLIPRIKTGMSNIAPPASGNLYLSKKLIPRLKNCDFSIFILLCQCNSTKKPAAPPPITAHFIQIKSLRIPIFFSFSSTSFFRQGKFFISPTNRPTIPHRYQVGK